MRPPSAKKKIAALATAFFPKSHADVILSRWRTPLPTDTAWGWRPSGRCQLASLYVEQREPGHLEGKADLSASFTAKEALYPATSVEDALTLGTGTLAVEGVLLIAEHGSYPINPLGQIVYPRKAWFDRVANVFRRAGRSVPVFCDKHFSYETAGAAEMVETARELGFALFGGSSMPLCDFEPPLSLNPVVPLKSALGIFWGGPETYGFHGLELLATLLGKRPGGEAGLRAITAWRGAKVREMLGRIPAPLRETALVPLLGTPEVQAALGGDSHRLVFAELEHHCGLTSHLLGLERASTGFLVAYDQGAPCVSHVRTGSEADGYGHFARLNAQIENLILTGRAPLPPEQTLFTTCTLVHFMEALAAPGERHPIPKTSPAYVPYRSS